MKPMTTIEFMTRKNAILKEMTGLVLIPEDQLKAVAPERLYMDDSDGGMCPYCQTFDAMIDCEDCPMSIAGNNCEQRDSTYMAVYNHLKESSQTIHETPAILDLVAEFNKQFEED